MEGNCESFYYGSFANCYSLDLIKPSWLSEWTGEPTECVCET